jgi:hypothetical protein
VAGRPRNDLWYINTDTKKKYVIEKVEAIGVPPLARYGHAMVYYYKRQYLIIYGGRNDELWENYGSCSMSSIFLLNLMYMCWCPVKVVNYENPRYSMSYFLDDSKLYVVGGFNEETFLPGKVAVLEVDEEKIPQIDWTSNKMSKYQGLTAEEMAKISKFEIPSDSLKLVLNSNGFRVDLDKCSRRSVKGSLVNDDIDDYWKRHKFSSQATIVTQRAGAKGNGSIFQRVAMESSRPSLPVISEIPANKYGGYDFSGDGGSPTKGKRGRYNIISAMGTKKAPRYNKLGNSQSISDLRSFQPVPMFRDNLFPNMTKSYSK